MCADFTAIFFNLFGRKYFTSGIFIQLRDYRWIFFSGLRIISQLTSDKPSSICNCNAWFAHMPGSGLPIGSAVSLWPVSVYILYICRARWGWKWLFHTQFRMLYASQVKHIKEITIQTKINQMFTESQLFQKMSTLEEYLCDPTGKIIFQIMWVKLNQREIPPCQPTAPCMILLCSPTKTIFLNAEAASTFMPLLRVSRVLLHWESVMGGFSVKYVF